ncbi:hypothetical protein TrST_g12519 [Triparma strigata]|uniref:AB hydrolase-1 domain-containing protein n=1 Tax=Triparma strigata TaxID=1606541 RepID=A0A9W7B9A0_9STRA|nr:hypothetical protein TrST_g12519 [Triparma strigata]
MCQRRRQSVRGPLRLPEAVDSKFLRQFIVAGWQASSLGYFVKVVMIGSIKSILPLTVAGLIWRLYNSGGAVDFTSAFNWHALAELLFFVFYLKHRTQLSRERPLSNDYVYPGRDRQEKVCGAGAKQRLKRNLRHMDGVLGKSASKEDRQRHFLDWFSFRQDDCHSKAPEHWSELKKENLADWLAWAFWARKVEELGAEEEEEIEQMITLVEEWAGEGGEGGELDGGRNDSLISMRLSIDEIRSAHHPLIHYLVTHAGCCGAGYVLLKWRGFERKKIGGMVYWRKEGRSGGEGERCPIVFISGIGIGLVAYLKLVDRWLEEHPGREIFLVDLPEYSLRFTTSVSILSPLDRASALTAMLGGRGAHFVGHSLGSVVISWVIRLAPESVVKAATFIDPVCFLLFHSSVAANFVYRPPATPLDCLVSYFVAKELYVNNALHRHFRWQTNLLDPALLEDIKGVSVVLSDHDHYVPSQAVERHLNLEAPKVRTRVLGEHSHAQFCVLEGTCDVVMEEFRFADEATIRN